MDQKDRWSCACLANEQRDSIELVHRHGAKAASILVIACKLHVAAHGFDPAIEVVERAVEQLR